MTQLTHCVWLTLVHTLKLSEKAKKIRGISYSPKLLLQILLENFLL